MIPPYYFCNFSRIPYVLINSHRYLRLIICLLNHWVKGISLVISLVPCLVIQENWKLRYNQFCRYTPQFFIEVSLISNVFIDINGNENELICI